MASHLCSRRKYLQQKRRITREGFGKTWFSERGQETRVYLRSQRHCYSLQKEQEKAGVGSFLPRTPQSEGTHTICNILGSYERSPEWCSGETISTYPLIQVFYDQAECWEAHLLSFMAGIVHYGRGPGPATPLPFLVPTHFSQPFPEPRRDPGVDSAYILCQGPGPSSN